ncbi:23S rRNA (uracil(1939)-C(5))-methyltransferase RlmD [Peptostreptococcus canis]|uniref:23S rRNA (Uracil(1939)-C(5))-methyltransferase RlmD n=1 Tax=Peptostreptococcus canis TaxID=1159213 RepID=A0ABR6TJ96_9FIRM|nr:23S rRNA (uracil(1939)-C(5))-methyltransferase RlmD [Peptostreptococcus canis]MBC2575496.1 23S rRNA (uracil(1939)-C(5))-methyltransferase RlmD [Peptostreptococcus canis]MBP1997312.1 23S rRNA (uracil1939-C5)-methyltransferase [Peptostreptococcus canis]
MLEIGKKYECKIVDIGQGGVGIGKYEGFTVFIDGALLGEIVDVKITKSKKKYAEGVISKIKKASEYRVERVCPMKYRNCGGCQIQELDYKKQLEIKTNQVKEDIKRIAGLEDIEIKDTIGMEKPFRYRNKAQFPVKMIDGKLKIGFYKKKSHDVIDIEKCVIQHEKNDEIIEIIREYIIKNDVSVYDEKTHKGGIRHIVTKVGYATDEVMVVLVSTTEKLPGTEALVEELKSKIDGFKTFVININKEKTNVVLGRKNINIYGDGKITDYIGKLKFEISPLSFFQVNPIQTEVLYNKALEFADIKEGDKVFDIYCGIGTISLFLAQKAEKVYGVEIVPEAIDDANKNARLNNMDNLEFFVGKAEEVVPEIYKKGKRANIVVVDPPRKGCDEKVLDTIVGMKPERIVYVSCNPSTLARDLKYLDERGYQCQIVQPVDMFPHSIHVECIALIQRVKS